MQWPLALLAVPVRGRRSAQAYLEFIPMRGVSHLDVGKPGFVGCHRTLHFGDLASVVSASRLLLLRDSRHPGAAVCVWWWWWWGAPGMMPGYTWEASLQFHK